MMQSELFFGLDRMPRHADASRLPRVVLGPAPLRLCTIALPPDNFPAIADHAARQAALADWLFGQCGLYAPLRRAFIAAYLEWIATRIADHAAELTSGLARFGELYAATDWLWSAPRPLPRALINLPDDRHVCIDAAFWDGSRIIGVVLGDAAIPAGLEAAGISICRFSGAELADEVQALLTARLPASFQTYWRDAPLPISPFRRPIPGGPAAQSVISST